MDDMMVVTLVKMLVELMVMMKAAVMADTLV